MSATTFKDTIRLPVCIGTKHIYLHETEGTLSLGPSGPQTPPVVIAKRLPKGDRRKLRKSLAEYGSRNVAIDSIPN